MVANGYDGLNGRVERGIGTPTPSDLNGVDVYQHFFCNEGLAGGEDSVEPPERPTVVVGGNPYERCRFIVTLAPFLVAFMCILGSIQTCLP